MYFNGFFLEGQARERVDQKVTKFLIDILLDVLSEYLILTLLFKLHGIFDIPA